MGSTKSKKTTYKQVCIMCRGVDRNKWLQLHAAVKKFGEDENKDNRLRKKKGNPCLMSCLPLPWLMYIK